MNTKQKMKMASGLWVETTDFTLPSAEFCGQMKGSDNGWIDLFIALISEVEEKKGKLNEIISIRDHFEGSHLYAAHGRPSIGTNEHKAYEAEKRAHESILTSSPRDNAMICAGYKGRRCPLCGHQF